VGDEIAAEINSRHEGRAATVLFEAIVDYLDAKHLIDRKRLVWLRLATQVPLSNTLSHTRNIISRRRWFADASNLGYFSYVAFTTSRAIFGRASGSELWGTTFADPSSLGLTKRLTLTLNQ